MSELKEKLEKRYKKHDVLLQNIKDRLGDFEILLDKYGNNFSYEDRMYRFYHHSFKVYVIQEWTEEIVQLLKEVSPHSMEELYRENRFSHFCKEFDEIYHEGTGWKFAQHHNSKWSKVTRPMLEAFFHAKYFLEMAVKYGKELDKAPQCMPSGMSESGNGCPEMRCIIDVFSAMTEKELERIIKRIIKKNKKAYKEFYKRNKIKKGL
jgi:hypothetical protein